MVQIESLLSPYLKGDLFWVEGALYASYLGSRLALGVGSPDPTEGNYQTLRLANLNLSIYDQSGFGSGIPTAFLDDGLLNPPADSAQFRKCLAAVCAVAAHESCHHRINSQFKQFFVFGVEMDPVIPPDTRVSILEQLDVRASMRDSYIPMATLRGYWAASARQMQSLYPSLNNIDAAFLARSEFFCEVAACVARLHFLQGAGYVQDLIQTLKDGKIVPKPVPHLLADIFDSGCNVNAELEARESVKNVLKIAGTNPTLIDRHQQIVDELWPSDLSRTIERIRPTR